MIEKLMDRLFKKNIKTEDTGVGILPDERRLLWAAIVGLFLLQILLYWYMSTHFETLVNDKIAEIDRLINPAKSRLDPAGLYGN